MEIQGQQEIDGQSMIENSQWRASSPGLGVGDEPRRKPGLLRDQVGRALGTGQHHEHAPAKGYADEDPERLYREVEALLSQVVDFDSFARSVMGPHSRDASEAQLERFSETFKWGLVRTYALALTEFNDGEVVVVPPDRPPRNPKRQTVKMEIRTSAGEVYPVLYSVTQEDDGSWVIRNLIVNGVNMGLTYRNQFNSAMNDPKYGGKLDAVIDAWAELLRAEAPDLGAGGGEQEA